MRKKTVPPNKALANLERNERAMFRHHGIRGRRLRENLQDLQSPIPPSEWVVYG